MYSSIIKKTCACGCGRWPSTGYKGFFMDCRPDLKEEKVKRQAERQKARNSVTRTQSKLRSLVKTDDAVREGSKKVDELERWFREIRKTMTGKCMNCGGKTEANTKLFKNSIAHILPKAYFKSVATHPDNFLELCFYGNSCHTNFDNKMIDLIDLHCFDTVIQKFTKIYPHIAKEERRRIPQILIDYLNTEI